MSAHELELLAQAFDLARYRLNPWSVGYFVCSLVVLLLAVLVLAEKGRGRDPVRRAFGINMLPVIFLMLGSGLCLSAGDADQALGVVRIAIASGAFIGPATLYFACTFTGWRDHLRVLRGLLWAFSTVLAVLSVSTSWIVGGTWQAFGGFFAAGGFLVPLVLIDVFVGMVAALVVYVGKLRETRDPEARSQLRYVLLAYGIGLLVFPDTLELLRVPIPPTMYVWVTLSAVIMTQAIRQHKALGADLGWRAFAWVFASLLVVIPIVLVLLASQGWSGWQVPWATAVTIVLMTFGVYGYFRAFQPRIDGLFLRQRRDLERELAQLADRLLVLHTEGDIARDAARVVERTLFVKLVALATPEEDGGWRVAYSAWGSVPPPQAEDPFVARVFAEGRLVSKDEVTDAESDFSEDERIAAGRLLARYGGAFALPVARPGVDRSIALVLLGPRPDGRPFAPLERDFLARLGQALVAPLEAARLFDRRHRLKGRLEEMVRARSDDLRRAVDGLARAQRQLVQSEKMATLGLVVGGVASEIERAVGTVAGQAPALAESVGRWDVAAERVLAALPEGERGESVRDWARKARLDYIRRDVPDLVESIAEGARRAGNIAHDLRRFARAGESAWHKVLLSREIDGTLNLVAHELKGRVEVKRSYDPKEPPVLCDRGPLGQVFMNLIINAVQAIEGRGTLEVGTRVRDGGARVEVYVRDSGCGIEREHLDRIFEPFFTTKELGQRGGSGLGLSVSYGIVERHDGTIEVDSEVGKGTEFRVILPVEGPLSAPRAASS